MLIRVSVSCQILVLGVLLNAPLAAQAMALLPSDPDPGLELRLRSALLSAYLDQGDGGRALAMGERLKGFAPSALMDGERVQRPVRTTLVVGFALLLMVLGLLFHGYRLKKREQRRRDSLAREPIPGAEESPLPEAPPAREAPANLAASPVATRVPVSDGPKVLVVDDDPVNRMVLGQMLQSAGYQVLEAVDGPQALERVDAQIQLVLLDVMMPQMSGFEVCRRLRERFSMRRLPVIFVTAKDRPEDLAEGFAAGGTDYLTKPVAMDELLARIQAHLRRTDPPRG